MAAAGSTWLRRKNLWFYIFIAPFFLQFAIFQLFPMVWAFWLSFHEWAGIGSMTAVGWQNYVQAVHDPLLWQSLGNTLYLWFFGTAISMSITFVVAFVLNSGLVRCKEFFRTAFFLPQVTSLVVVGIIFLTLYGREYGILNQLVNAVFGTKIDWLGQSAWIKPSIILLSFWHGFGWFIVMYLAGLQSIPEELYEAARVDGASLPQQFLHITIPMLRNVIVFLLLMSFINGLQSFVPSFILLNGTGGTGNAGLTIVMYLYQHGFTYFNLGYGSSLAWLLFVMIVAGTLLQIKFVGLNRK